MHNTAERSRLSTWQQGQQPPIGDHQPYEKTAHHQRQGSYTRTRGGAALGGESLLLSRSIRGQARPRTAESLSPEARGCRARSADDGNDSRVLQSEFNAMEVPPSLGRQGASSASTHLSTGCPRTPSSSPTAELEMPLPIETLWSNIDRYLFAVYTTLQTGDESSLRPLRTPKHRMGWYTVIYNACSGDPTKSRELYARLALLLLHILESHVLFPILRHVDHSRVHFVTGTEDDAGTRSNGGSPQWGQGSRNAPTGSGTATGSSSSSSGWGRFKSIATAVRSASVHGTPTSEASRNSSFMGAASGNGNGSFAFMKRLLYPLSSPAVAARAVRASPAGGGGHHATEGDGGVGRPPPSPQAPTPTGPANGGAAKSSSGGARGTNSFAWTSCSSIPFRPRSSGALASSGSPAPANELQTAFAGFDCTVRHSPGGHSAVMPLHPLQRITGRSIAESAQPGATTSPPQSPVKAEHAPLTLPSVTSRHSTQQAAHVSAELSPLTRMARLLTPIGEKALPMAAQSAGSPRHTRVASKTGRVLVDDEEEVLCEVNTVSPAARDSLRQLQRCGSGSNNSSVAALASFNDTEAGSVGSRTDADADDDSLHTMNSSFSSEKVARERRLRVGKYAGEGANAAAARGGARGRATACTGAGPCSGDAHAVGTREPLPTCGSPFTSTLTPFDDVPSPFSSTVPSATMRSTVTTVPPSPPKSNAGPFSASERRTWSSDTKTASDISVAAADDVAHELSLSSPDATVTLAPPEASAMSDTGSTSPIPPPLSAAVKTTTAVRAAGAPRRDERRFSLCYTFLQEWHTFVVFRSVVLSCFRYLDQYYTRRFGMDTITLMCFKVFYVVVYEPLQPLLVIELRHLMQYVREVFEATGQVACEQLGLIQDTYSIITELLLLVQSTSSSMVAQQPPPQTGSGVSGSGGSGVTAAAAMLESSNAPSASAQLATSSAATAGVAPPATADMAAAETAVRGYTSSRAHRTISGQSHSPASSAASTPRQNTLNPPIASGTVTAPPPPAGDEERSGARPQGLRRHRLMSLFTSGRFGDGPRGGSNSSRDQRATSTPVSPWASPALETASPAGVPSAFERESGATADGKVVPRPQAQCDGDSGEISGREEADCRGAKQQGSAAVIGRISAPVVVVDLRGTVELHDRLESNTTTHSLTKQALKQWEGMAAARRLHLGTIVKEIVKPLATIVMEDVGNEYIAGIYAFYRCAREAHRSTEEGRRGYVEWADSVKELEKHVWRRVQLPFLHASLRSALNEVLVVEPHRSILLDARFGLRAVLDVWSSSVEAAGLGLAPQLSAAAARSGGAGTQVCGSRDAAAFHWQIGSVAALTPLGGEVDEAGLLASRGAQPGGSKELEALTSLAAHGSHASHALPSPHPRTAPSLPFAMGEGQGRPSQILFVTSAVEEEDGRRHGDHGSGALSVAQQTTAASSDTPATVAAATSSIDRSSSGCFPAHAGDWAGKRGVQREQPTLATATMPCMISATGSGTYAMGKKVAAGSALAPHRELGGQSVLSTGTVAAVDSGGLVSAEGEGGVTSALAALESLYHLFSDVTEDECFVLMAAVIITKLIRDAADIIEQHLRAVSGLASAASQQPHPQAAGVELMAGLVALMERYTELVEGVFHNHAIVHRALSDATEELMRPVRWTQKGVLQTSQQRAHEALMAAAAAAAKAETADGSLRGPASSAGADLPNVLLSRDARQATLPLVELAANYPQAVQQLKLSTLLARYADALLQQERGGGRVLSSKLHKRLRLVAQLVSLLEDKDTFLEHYRLCLARRLLGYSSGPAVPHSGAPSGAACGVVGGRTKPSLAVGRAAHGSSAAASLNMEAERQLVSFLQLYVGATGTHAFEAMLRDYEGTERTRELFEQEEAYQELPAKIRVQLITSAQWPTYAMPPLQTHISLQRGMEAFRAHYAKQHPSRTLLWVFSLGSATLTVELVSGAKQVVASTILATLLLVVSDAYNAEGADAGQGGALTGAELARIVGLPFHYLRAHLHLLTQHRAFHLLQRIPANSGTGSGGVATAATAPIMESDAFTLNPFYTHKLRKIHLPLPKTRPTGLPPGDADMFGGGVPLASRPDPHATPSSSASKVATTPVSANADEDAAVARHVQATRRVLLDAALVRIFKSRRVVLFEDLLQTVTAHLSRQFVPSRRDVKAQLEGLIDRDYVKRSPDDANTFIYLS
ncbi:hypothetical protein LSCM1_05766 [Leishmania martiniquensis]|uniref:Cullin family profile domain-containing protein n=1 Tax=Leishmania martiniquensis TaxID=1580590 RepID=A0A836HQ01_9TRYP|nr:hypothetical protein LSCM1_05766 [Leishmania martiniquensis]